jgi:hypothetical protein
MSSSKNNPSSKAGSFPNVSPEVAAEIARLMRDPNALRDERRPDVDAEIARLMRDPDALRHERGDMQRGGGRGHYDPNRPRVPAGDPKGGQFASKGYRGGDAGRDAVKPMQVDLRLAHHPVPPGWRNEGHFWSERRNWHRL